MSQQYHLGSGSPTKRRRGRPRKDESLSRAPFIIKTIQTEGDRSAFQPHTSLGKGKSPLYEANTCGVNRENQMIGQVVIGEANTFGVNKEDHMIGQVVIGFLEGTFDAGYLLSMRVAESEICLKGLAFQDGKFLPITSENDVAPFARMYSRTDLPSPVGSVSVSICESIQCEKSNVVESTKDKTTKQPDLGEPQLEEIIVGLPNEASTEYEFSIAKEGDVEESNAKEKLEILASLSVEMDFTNPFMDVCEGENALHGQSHELAQQNPPMEPLAKKPKTKEAMHWKEDLSAQELKAATTLNELELLHSIKEHGKV